MSTHWISASCVGETCNYGSPNLARCGFAATHKVGEVIFSDDPNPIRHELTAYLCCEHFAAVMGHAASCIQDGGEWYKP